MYSRPNGLIDVDLMVDDWDGVILRQYKRNVLSWRPERILERRIGDPQRLRLSTEHIWDCREYFKRKLVYLFGKKEIGLPVWEKGTRKA